MQKNNINDSILTPTRNEKGEFLEPSKPYRLNGSNSGFHDIVNTFAYQFINQAQMNSFTYYINDPMQINTFAYRSNDRMQVNKKPSVFSWSSASNQTSNTNTDEKVEDIEKTSSKRIVGDVYGIRSFAIHPHKDSLEGGFGVRWYSPRQNAKCLTSYNKKISERHHPIAPCDNHRTCRCGINIYKIDDMYKMNYSSNDILAITRGWGKIAIHEDGYRVQKALLVALIAFNKESLDTVKAIFAGQKREPLITSNLHEWVDWMKLYSQQDKINTKGI